MISIKAHINNIALHHTIFDLPFAFMAAILASNGSPNLWTLFLIALAVTSGRAAAMAINNLADLEYDKKQPRMSYRAMVRGEITVFDYHDRDSRAASTNLLEAAADCGNTIYHLSIYQAFYRIVSFGSWYSNSNGTGRRLGCGER